MRSHGSGGPSTASFVITNRKTGEVLLEVAPPFASSPTAVGEEAHCGLFSDAFVFITEVQKRSYDHFGQGMAKEAQARCQDADAPRGRRERYVDAMMNYDAPSSSCMDSAEWEGDGDDNGDADDGSDSGLGNRITGDGGVPVSPKKKLRSGLRGASCKVGMTEEYLHTFAAGTISGAVGVLLEYPLDTLKVRLQAYNRRYKGYWDCAVQLVRNEGVFSFYHGVSTRIVGSALEHALVFSFYKWTLRQVGADEFHPFLWQIALGGVGGGVASTVFLTPLELVKCHLQVAKLLPVDQRRYHGVVDCAVTICRQGGVAALYRGGFAMLAREVPGIAAYCGTYDKAKEFLTPAGGSTEELSVWRLMFAGGCSGVAFWTVFFPADVVKTRVQVDPAFARCGFAEALRLLYAEGGMRALYCGWTGTAVRAFPSNAALFATYDLCMRSFKR